MSTTQVLKASFSDCVVDATFCNTKLWLNRISSGSCRQTENLR